jgi:hypothetical protein
MKRPSSDDRTKAQRSREDMRSQGLRQVRLWVYDRRSPGFLSECHRQSLAASQSEAAAGLKQLLDGSLSEIDDWTAQIEAVA